MQVLRRCELTADKQESHLYTCLHSPLCDVWSEVERCILGAVKVTGEECEACDGCWVQPRVKEEFVWTMSLLITSLAVAASSLVSRV